MRKNNSYKLKSDGTFRRSIFVKDRHDQKLKLFLSDDGLWFRTDKFGNHQYYDEKGNLHRENGPAWEFKINSNRISDITQIQEGWYKHGKLHRENGPAKIMYDKVCYYINGDFHREDGPAIEFNSNNKWNKTFNIWHKGFSYSNKTPFQYWFEGKFYPNIKEYDQWRKFLKCRSLW